MDSLFKTVNIVDSRVAHIKSELPFAVLSGSAQNTYQPFGSISQGPSTITYNIQVPSMSTVIDRNVLQQSTIQLAITATGVPVGSLAMDYGNTDSLQAFPLNSLITTQSATINNSTVTTNLQDILPQVLRMYDNKTLERYNSITPALPDRFWKNYANAVGTNSNPMSAMNVAGYEMDLMPRGAFPVSMVVTHNIHAGGPPDDSLVSTDPADTWSILLTFTVVEPILGLAPFAHSDNNDQAGFLGINNLVMTFNLDAGCKRVFSSSTGYITGIRVNSVTNSSLLLNFLSLQPEQYGKIQPKNVLPYLDFPRYAYSPGTIVPASPANGPINGATQVTFNNVQFNQVPDLIIICARKPMTAQNWQDTSSFLTIKNVAISFNNNVGILSTANQQQLFLMSTKNGSSQTFYEFCGNALNNNNATGKGQYVPTLGSILVLNPAMDFGLPSMYTASSGGQFNFQCTLDLINQTSADIAPEIVVMCVNSGLFVTENGTSMIHTGILTRDQVLDTKNQDSKMDSSFYHRIIGSGISNIKAISHVFHHHKGEKKEQGSGESAGGMSAGGVSAGNVRHRKPHRYC